MKERLLMFIIFFSILEKYLKFMCLHQNANEINRIFNVVAKKISLEFHLETVLNIRFDHLWNQSSVRGHNRR